MPADQDHQMIFWIASPGEEVRHATREQPGALVASSRLNALCGTKITVPLATPYGSEPRSKITARCGDCITIVKARNVRNQRNWDF